MKNKVTVLLLTGLMVIGSLSGCSSAANDKAGTPAQVTAEEEAARRASEEAARQASEEAAKKASEDAAKQASEEVARKAEEEAAAKKEAEANEYYETGRAYLYGLDGKEVNLESAQTNFEKAEELGKVEANFYLGVLYGWYNYPKQDYEMARTHYEKCGDDPYAQLALGYLYFEGQGVEENKERAKELFQSAIDQGCVEGYLGIGRISYDEEKYEAAMENYTKALEGTEQIFIADAMGEIGYLYHGGDGVAQDYASAMEWYKKAADLGDKDATSNIGYLYYMGSGVKQDYAAAMEWFKKAADLGNADAMFNVAFMYECGNGVEQDYAAAAEWYKKAADLGHVTAMNKVAAFYFNGVSVKQDYALAMEWSLKAADLGDTEAMVNIGNMYWNGFGVKQDYAAALEWVEKAAALGDAEAKETAEYLRQIM